jgi:hypothetical protein
MIEVKKENKMLEEPVLKEILLLSRIYMGIYNKSLVLLCIILLCACFPIKYKDNGSSVKPVETTENKLFTITNTNTKTINTETPLFTSTYTSTSTNIITLPSRGWAKRGLSSKRIFSILIDPSSPNIVYASTASGIYKSSNKGLEWYQITQELTVAIAIDPKQPTTIYSGGYDWIEGDYRGYGWSIILRSTNGGGRWTSSDHIGYDNRISSIVIDPNNPSIIYTIAFGARPCCTEYNGVYKSMDNGKTWFQILVEWVYSIVIDPSDSLILYAQTSNGVMKSTDGGNNWKLVFDNIWNLIIDPNNANLFYATNSENYVVSSSDAGKSWKIITRGLPNKDFLVWTIEIDPIDPGIILLGTSKGIYKSISGGEQWFYDGLSDMTIRTIAIDPIDNRYIYAGTDNGIYFTS